MDRQQIRKILLILAFISLPVTLVYISPIIILLGAAEGIMTGSMVLFIITFLASLLLGRFWCGWLCPMGGWQDICGEIQKWPVSGGKYHFIKYGFWAVWFVILISLIAGAGGIREVNIFYNTDSGFSVTEPAAFGVYFILLGMMFLMVIIAGKRGMCHYLCPISVHFIIARTIRNFFHWPALHLSAEKDLCISCRRCSKGCPMGLDVQSMVHDGRMETSECILCGSCADTCPRGAISFGFR